MKESPDIQTIEAEGSWKLFIAMFWQFLEEFKYRFAGLNIVLFLVHLWELVPPIALAYIVENFASQSGDQIEKFYLIAIGVGLGTAVAAAIRLSAKQQINQLKLDLQYKVRLQSFSRILSHSLDWNDSESTGNIMKRIDEAVQSVNDILVMINNDLYNRFARAIFAIIALFAFGYEFVLAVILFVFVLLAVQRYYKDKIDLLYEKQNQTDEQVSGKYYEAVSQKETIKMLGVESQAAKEVRTTLLEYTQQGYQIEKYSMDTWRFYTLFLAIVQVAFYLIAFYKVARGDLPIAALVIIFAYLGSVYSASTHMSSTYFSLLQAKSRLLRYLPIANEVQTHDGTQPFPNNWQTIEFKGVNFSYPRKPELQILDNFNLKIHQGDKIAIWGQSGGGKSTLIKLLMQAYVANSGDILIDGRPINTYTHTSVTERIVVAPQQVELMNTSVRKNICLFDDLPDSMINQVMELAGLNKVVAHLPQGLDTVIGEDGARLSGGERQRLGIARALCRQADMYVFDEALSNLDVEMAKQITDQLLSFLADKTVIFISHRPEVIAEVGHKFEL